MAKANGAWSLVLIIPLMNHNYVDKNFPKIFCLDEHISCDLMETITHEQKRKTKKDATD